MELNYQRKVILAAHELSRRSYGSEGYEIRVKDNILYLRPLSEMNETSSHRSFSVILVGDSGMTSLDYMKEHISKIERVMQDFG